MKSNETDDFIHKAKWCNRTSSSYTKGLLRSWSFERMVFGIKVEVFRAALDLGPKDLGRRSAEDIDDDSL